ncbi:addiction module protein [Caenimonas aquaedulcis]|uniref:Addiction module protein n=1 Tax=Caenimonas aquaedulcis TaxID=2793270 RepID=A0A931MGZ3_9BURK|nr:addiction module protein [Caenimonas aquaedulcis]MBG9387740.1 addiction module protein [Caenimonas aquaedulcis]
MSHPSDDLGKAALQLPPAERVALVERILDSLDAPDSSLDAQWAMEAQDRLGAYRRGEIRAVELSEVLAKYQVTRQG